MPEVKKTQYTMLAPYASGVFGRIRATILDIRFDVCPEGTVKVLTIEGTDTTNGEVYDMTHLALEGDGEGIDNDLYNGIIHNQAAWNETYNWWNEDKPVENPEPEPEPEPLLA